MGPSPHLRAEPAPPKSHTRSWLLRKRQAVQRSAVQEAERHAGRITSHAGMLTLQKHHNSAPASPSAGDVADAGSCGLPMKLKRKLRECEIRGRASHDEVTGMELRSLMRDGAAGTGTQSSSGRRSLHLWRMTALVGSGIMGRC